MSDLTRLEGGGPTGLPRRDKLPVPHRSANQRAASDRSGRERGSASPRRHGLAPARYGKVAFLAQLSLQYDEIGVARTARRQRRQAAIDSYGTRSPGRPAEARTARIIDLKA